MNHSQPPNSTEPQINPTRPPHLPTNHMTKLYSVRATTTTTLSLPASRNCGLFMFSSSCLVSDSDVEYPSLRGRVRNKEHIMYIGLIHCTEQLFGLHTKVSVVVVIGMFVRSFVRPPVFISRVFSVYMYRSFVTRVVL